MIERAAIAADLGIKAHAHMLRHACGYKLANDGHDTRAIQAYLRHRNIQNTTRYTAWRRSGLRNFFAIDCPSDHVHSRKTPMAKCLLPFLGVIVASVGTQAFAQSAGFPCDAFKVQTNGRLEVVRPVTITGPSGKMTLNPGISFGPEGLYMGANIFELYRKSCH